MAAMLSRCFAMLLIAVGGIGRQEQERTVDLIELNHFRSEHSSGFDQVILYRWSPDYRRYDVQSWYLPDWPSGYPEQGPAGWSVEHKGTRYHGTLYRETWSDIDPERAQRGVFPERARRL